MRLTLDNHKSGRVVDVIKVSTSSMKSELSWMFVGGRSMARIDLWSWRIGRISFFPPALAVIMSGTPSNFVLVSAVLYYTRMLSFRLRIFLLIHRMRY